MKAAIDGWLANSRQKMQDQALTLKDLDRLAELTKEPR